ncbi:MAG: hypothetical protein IE926_05895 [Micrococcales bacterium]|nr:hypothetical protein [Micrococcales bacterium]
MHVKLESLPTDAVDAALKVTLLTPEAFETHPKKAVLEQAGFEAKEGQSCMLHESAELVAAVKAYEPDAVRDAGCPVERVLLIGGAAKSAAVQRIAPDLLGAPVAVPAPGEYVAVGAARQAAWALSGAASAPEWAVAVEATSEPVAPGAGAEARERYAAALATTYPGAAG